MASLEHMTTKMAGDSSSAMVRFCLGSSVEEEQLSLLESQVTTPDADNPDRSQRTSRVPMIIISGEEKLKDNHHHRRTSEDDGRMWQENASYMYETSENNKTNNASIVQKNDDDSSRFMTNDTSKIPTVTFSAEESSGQGRVTELDAKLGRPAPFGQWQKRIKTRGLKEMRKYSLPSKLHSQDEESCDSQTGLKQASGTDIELKHRHR